MFKIFFLNLKIIFHVANILLITLYLFPGSILGWFIYGDAGLQPQITSNFIVSSNHVYAFMVLSILGSASYRNNKFCYVFIYLFLISFFLEILHIIIPNRGFEFADLFGNILGVLVVYIFFQIYKYFKNSKKNEY